MSRTKRISRRTFKVVRDGTWQYAAASCRHHGGCKYCLANRTFNARKNKQILDKEVVAVLKRKGKKWK
jgi:hypothetical protein